MPIYEYVCASCSAEFEHLTLSRRAPGPDSCPECGATSVERKVSLSSFALKGGGWYKDGYSSTGGGGGSASKASDAGADTAPPKAEPKSDTKAAAGSSPKASSPSA